MDARQFKSVICGVAIAAAIAATNYGALAQSEIGESTIPPSPPAARVEQPSNAAPAVVAIPKAEARPSHPAAIIPYTIRSGDTIGSIAEMFGVSIDDVARANRINPDEELIAGAVLKVPKPFTAQVEALQSQVEALSAQTQASKQKADSAGEQIKSFQDQVQELTGDKDALQSSLKLLPWWRATAMGIGAAALLMFGVMALTLFEWWRMRRRFIALAEMTDALGHLDYKYKAMLAKAELRLQQLYGRRRQGAAEGQSRSKMPEEIEIERLNEELKEILEIHLQRLGARSRGARRGKKWREMVDDDVNQPAEAHSSVRH
jgi:LysM repeat protein